MDPVAPNRLSCVAYHEYSPQDASGSHRDEEGDQLCPACGRGLMAQIEAEAGEKQAGAPVVTNAI